MGTKLWFIRTDYYVQLAIVGGMAICCITIVGFIYAILGLIPLGIWQTGSGIFWAIGQRDKKRMIYLGVVALYFLIAYGATQYQMFNEFFPFLAAVPVFLGIMYFYMTWSEYKILRQAAPQKIEEADLLDA